VWNAWHYRENAVIEPAVKQTKKTFVDNSCGRYYQRVNRRREEERRAAMREMAEQMAAEEQRRQEDISATLRRQSEERKQQRRRSSVGSESGNDIKKGSKSMGDKACSVS